MVYDGDRVVLALEREADTLYLAGYGLWSQPADGSAGEWIGDLNGLGHTMRITPDAFYLTAGGAVGRFDRSAKVTDALATGDAAGIAVIGDRLYWSDSMGDGIHQLPI